MVSISEQLAQQRQQLGQAQAQVTTAEKRLQQQRQILSGQQAQLQPTGLDITRQQQLASISGRGGVTQLFKQQEAGKKIQLGKVSQAQEQLKEFGGKISARKAELSTFETGLTREADIAKGFEVARRGGLKLELESSAQRLGFALGGQAGQLEQLRKSELAQLQLQTPSTAPDFLTPSATEQKFPELFVQKTTGIQEFGMPISLPSERGGDITPGVSTRAGASLLFSKAVGGLNFLNVQGAKILPTTAETQERLLSRLDEPQKEFILSEIEQRRLESTTSEAFFRGLGTGVQDFIAEKPATTALFFGAGAGTGIILKGVGLGVKILGPTATALFETGVTAGGIGLAGLETFNIGKEVFFTPTAEGRGEVLGEEFVKIGAFGGGLSFGTRKFDTILDLIRTRGLKEVSAESVIAPEFFQGQTFPQVKRGQTAGEFKQEFFNIKLPGEKPGVARGFTASPKDFKSSTIIEEGTSEVPGLFSAPDLSPFFLKLQTERKFVGFGEFIGGSKPTAVRLTFEGLDFAPGVTSGTKAGGSLSSFRTFFESQRGTGKTFLPFAKREKEVITVADTAIGLTDKRFFFKFGGRRIPIKEFEVLGEGTASITNQKVGGISTISSELAIGRSTPIFSPLNLVIPPTKFDIPVRRRGGRRQPSISDLSLTPSFISDKSVFRSSFGSSDFTFRKERGGDSFGDFGKIGGFDGFDDSSRGRPRQPRDPKFPPFSEFPDRPRKEKPKKKRRVGRRRKSDDSKRKVSKVKGGRKFRSKIRPSFTATILELEGALPIGTKLGGIAPFDLRLARPGTFKIPKKKSTKNKKK